MASETDKQLPDNPVAASPDALTVNLQVISPSVGVNRPLLFPGLPADTTIKQLKDKIRQTLPLRPADENQRFIHRGRAILREADTLLDIFGADTLRNPEQQTIHLVIRETVDTHAAASSAGVRGRSLSPANQVPSLLRQPIPQQNPMVGPQVPPGFARRNITQSTPHLPMPRGASPARPPAPEQQPVLPGTPAFQQALAQQQALLQQQQQHLQHHAQHHAQHQNLTQWLTQLQRESVARQLIAQNQRNRAQLGMRGIGDAGGANGVPVPEPTSGRASPAPGHTVVREAWGPNGRTYQVETIIRSPAPNPQQGLSPVDVQNILRGADANQATAAMTSAMQRSASTASLHSRPLTQPGVTTPLVVPGLPGSHPPSGRVTPDLGYRFGNSGAASLSLAAQHATRQGLEVYILSSPEGPRALLVNNNTAETYYTPMARSQPSRSFHDLVNTSHDVSQPRQPDAQFPPLPSEAAQPAPPQGQQLTQEQQDHQQQQLQEQLRNGGVGVLHPHNPQLGAPMPRVIHLWPHLWNFIRLSIVIWIFSFTSPDMSWTRWSIMVCLAVITFIISTGVFNGLMDDLWRPVAGHMENLLRPAGHGARQGAGNVNGQINGQRHGEPEPAQMAARLVADQRGRGTWVAGQVRRLERAGLLFLASIAPGVAERHIASLEAEERAERQRREEEEAAARAAQEEAAAAATAAEDAGGAVGDGEEASDTRPQEPPAGDAEPDMGGQERDEQAVREPLIAL